MMGLVKSAWYVRKAETYGGDTLQVHCFSAAVIVEYKKLCNTGSIHGLNMQFVSLTLASFRFLTLLKIRCSRDRKPQFHNQITCDDQLL